MSPAWNTLWLVAAAQSAWAAPIAQPTASIEVDTDTLTVDQTVGLTILIQRADPAGVPAIPLDRGLSVRFVGQARDVSVTNGVVSQTVQLRYDLTAREVGTWHIGPVGVRVVDGNGKTVQVSADPITVDVLAAPDPSERGEPLRAEAGFNKSNVWQGEVVVWHEAVHAREQLANLQWFAEPEEGLLAPANSKPDARRYSTVDGFGTTYTYESWTPWIATTAARHDFEPPGVELEVIVANQGPGGLLGFFQRTRREVLMAPAPVLHVQALPPPPADFSGLVGEFSLQSRVANVTAQVGKNVAWTIVLSGQGALDGLKLPNLPADGARIYDAPPAFASMLREGAFMSQARFDRSIVPVREGTVHIPPLEIVTFSPEKGAYVTLHADGVDLEVKPGASVSTDIKSFSAASPEAADAVEDNAIRPLDARGPTLRLPWTSLFPWLSAALAFPGLWLGAEALVRALVQARRQRREAQALKAAPARVNLDKLASEPSLRLEQLALALDQALARRAHAQDQSPADALASLPSAQASAFGSLRTRIDRARFANTPLPTGFEDDVRAWIAQLDGGLS